jgi:hypothetical protein
MPKTPEKLAKSLEKLLLPHIAEELKKYWEAQATFYKAVAEFDKATQNFEAARERLDESTQQEAPPSAERAEKKLMRSKEKVHETSISIQRYTAQRVFSLQEAAYENASEAHEAAKNQWAEAQRFPDLFNNEIIKEAVMQILDALLPENEKLESVIKGVDLKKTQHIRLLLENDYGHFLKRSLSGQEQSSLRSKISSTCPKNAAEEWLKRGLEEKIRSFCNTSAPLGSLHTGFMIAKHKGISENNNNPLDTSENTDEELGKSELIRLFQDRFLPTLQNKNPNITEEEAKLQFLELWNQYPFVFNNQNNIQIAVNTHDDRNTICTGLHRSQLQYICAFLSLPYVQKNPFQGYEERKSTLQQLVNQTRIVEANRELARRSSSSGSLSDEKSKPISASSSTESLPRSPAQPKKKDSWGDKFKQKLKKESPPSTQRSLTPEAIREKKSDTSLSISSSL